MSDHFTEKAFVYSVIAWQNGLNNDLPAALKTSMLFTLAGLERVRAALGGYPIKITSGYRCDALNELVKGQKNSQHIRAEAVDFVCPAFGYPKIVCIHLAEMVHKLGIDQLILEETWVHVSFTPEPRYSVLTNQGGRYLEGIV